MLFSLDAAVAVLFATGSPGPQQIHGLEMLTLGIAEGNHCITGTRNTLRLLGASGHLSARAQAVMFAALDTYAQHRAILGKVRVYATVTPIAVSGPHVQSVHSNQSVITVPLDWFKTSAKVQPTALLAENLDDANLYLRIGEAGAILASWGYLSLSARPIHGGGGTISQVLQGYVGSGDLCLCLVDSDRACPGGVLGNTASSVQPFKSQQYPLSDVLETVARDAENLLPDTFYIGGFHSSPHLFPAADVLDRLTSATEFDARSHLDIKRGLSLRQVFALTPGSPERLFWESKVKLIIGLLPSPLALPCLAIGHCNAGTATACTCVVVPACTGDLLRRFLHATANQTVYQIIGSLDASVRPEWARLGTLIASWCIATKPLRL